MAERSKGGRSASVLTSSASTRPSTSDSGISSAPRLGVCLRTMSRASSTGIMRLPSLLYRAAQGPPERPPGGPCIALGWTFRRSRVVRTVEWDDESVVLIDQRRLPHEESYLRCHQPAEVAAAIRDMAVRGAPAIGVSAAFGIALGARRSAAEGEALRRDFEAVCEQMRVTRPTAVNLFWAIERMRRRFQREEPRGGAAVRDGLLAEAQAIMEEDLASCHRMGDLGAELITRPSRILTHCNAGALATAGYGTALGVIRSAARDGH